MKNNFFFNYRIGNIYSKPSIVSEVSSQILYGEKFSIISKSKEWIKIKTNYDKYTGYIKKKKFTKYFVPTHKIYKLKTQIYKKINNKFVSTNQTLYFASRIEILATSENFLKFEKNNWIKKKDVKKISHFEKNFVKLFKSFIKTKYLWGGKSCKGIDCSALIQIFFYYNNIFFPRDTKDQIKYCANISKIKYKSGDIIFWKGHVAICLSSKNLIHAYGPEKKVLIMPIIKTINKIKETAKLKVKKITKIKY
jgi:cell wall-associated NlpC family hydrolase